MNKVVIVMVIALIALVGCGYQSEVTVQGDNTFVVDAGDGITLTIDPTPVLDAPGIEGQEYIEQEDGTITIVRGLK